MRTPFFSVIIPCYNPGETFHATLASLNQQSFRDFEVIVVDDGSTDVSREFIRSTLGKFPDLSLSFVQLDQNQGPSAARNAGVKQAKGVFLSFLDSDDCWNSERLKIVHDELVSSGTKILGHGMKHDNLGFNHDGGSSQLSLWNFLISNKASMSTLVVERAGFPMFDESMRYCEDYDLALRLLEKKPFVFLRKVLGELGRPVLSPGGHSSTLIQMRVGEMRTYLKFCIRNPLRLLILPILINFSLAKHLLKVFGGARA